MCFQKRKSALVGVFLEKNPMTNKIKKFLYIIEHLIPDGRDEIPTFALYHPLLSRLRFNHTQVPIGLESTVGMVFLYNASLILDEHFKVKWFILASSLASNKHLRLPE